MYSQIISIVQLVLAILLILVILLQQKGSGMGAAFGGSGTVYTTKRGLDKVLHQTTIVISVLFFAVAIANLLI